MDVLLLRDAVLFDILQNNRASHPIRSQSPLNKVPILPKFPTSQCSLTRLRIVYNMHISYVKCIFKKMYLAKLHIFQSAYPIFHCFTVHFNSLNFTHQLIHFYIYSNILV